MPVVQPVVHASPMYGVTLWVHWIRLSHPPCGCGVAGGVLCDLRCSDLMLDWVVFVYGTMTLG